MAKLRESIETLHEMARNLVHEVSLTLSPVKSSGRMDVFNFENACKLDFWA